MTLYARTTRRMPPGDAGPLLHAGGTYPPAASRTGRNVTAVCGTSVRPSIVGPWDPDDDRACPGCVRVVRARAAADASARDRAAEAMA